MRQIPFYFKGIDSGDSGGKFIAISDLKRNNFRDFFFNSGGCAYHPPPP